MKRASWPLLFAFGLIFSFVAPAGIAHAVDFDKSYAAPFGFRADARMESYAHFGFRYENGDVACIGQDVFGGIFALQLGVQDKFAFEIQTTWRRIEESYQTPDYDKTNNGYELNLIENRSYSNSAAEIRLTPKYRFLHLDWLWMSASLTAGFPIITEPNFAQVYEVSPGIQAYFDVSKDWFGIELNVNYLMEIVDPEDTPKGVPQPSTEVVSGLFARANFLLKLYKIVYISAQIEDTIWFRDIGASESGMHPREAEIKAMLRHLEDIRIHEDRVDMRYYANHKLDAGGGVRVIYKFWEAGIGATGAITQQDRRQNFGIVVDSRFRF